MIRGLINCVVCGAERAAYEDARSITFCGKCEERYRREQAELAEDAYKSYLARLPEDGGGECVLTRADFMRDYGV